MLEVEKKLKRRYPRTDQAPMHVSKCVPDARSLRYTVTTLFSARVVTARDLARQRHPIQSAYSTTVTHLAQASTAQPHNHAPFASEYRSTEAPTRPSCSHSKTLSKTPRGWGNG